MYAQATKGSINHYSRVCVDIPFDADNDLESAVRKLNDARPFNQFDCVSKTKEKQIASLQSKTLFLWIRHWVLTCINKRVSFPAFLTSENLFQTFFKSVYNEYLRLQKNAFSYAFDGIKARVKLVQFEKVRIDERELKEDLEVGALETDHRIVRINGAKTGKCVRIYFFSAFFQFQSTPSQLALYMGKQMLDGMHPSLLLPPFHHVVLPIIIACRTL